MEGMRWVVTAAFRYGYTLALANETMKKRAVSEAQN